MLGLAAALAAAGGPVWAQETSTVTFRAGDFGTMVTGTVTGRQYRDYRLGARAGQEMALSLAVASTDGNGSAYFNLLPPGSDDVAIYNSSSEGNDAVVPLPETGDYTIRVYLMGNDRDTERRVDFNLDLSIQ